MLDIVAACADVEGLRSWVHDLDRPDLVTTEAGDLWLPVVWTARGPLYAEVIAQHDDGKYFQPFHLSDRDRQPLYRLAQNLLSYLDAPPSVYLLKFTLVNDTDTSEPTADPDQPDKKQTGHKIGFDRLIPFPDEPAIASIGVQEPNLFVCHWLCLTNQPIYDLVIK
jgi:hypothetical protein